jgi:hypothetical protein
VKIKTTRIILAVLILIPSTVNLLVPLYNKEMPDIMEIPFFYWFQTIWLVVCSGFYLTFAFFMKKKEEEEEEEEGKNNASTEPTTGVHKFS